MICDNHCPKSFAIKSFDDFLLIAHYHAEEKAGIHFCQLQRLKKMGRRIVIFENPDEEKDCERRAKYYAELSDRIMEWYVNRT